MKTLQLDPSVEFQAVKLAEGSTSLYLSQLSLHQSLIFFLLFSVHWTKQMSLPDSHKWGFLFLCQVLPRFQRGEHP